MIGIRRLRAPQQDGEVFADPPLAAAERLLKGAAWERQLPADLAIFGRPLGDLRRLGREGALQAAQTYLAASGQDATPRSVTPVLAAGHQPEVFHPGVWVKNFALQGLAAATGLTPLNLVVDNDTVKSTALAVPYWQDPRDPAGYRVLKIAFDNWAGESPYEEYRIRDEQSFETLPQRMAESTKSWGFQPLVADYWGQVMESAKRTPLLGERLAAARRSLERRWGCSNLEVPVSRLCETEPFACFAGHLLSELGRFHAVYNETVHEYRREHGLRSRNHPVPDLGADGEWREVPLWAWRAGTHRRGRLFVRQSAEVFELRVDGQEWPSLPRSPAAFLEGWRRLHKQGYKLRSRALTTTLFTRLFVADAFIHGIGGGKYDELTDELMRRFYGVTPPPYLVLSATLLLPLPGFPATIQQRRQLDHETHDLRWNPQRHLNGPSVDPRAQSLAKQKMASIAERAGDGPMGLERHRQLRRLTEELEPFVARLQGQKQQELIRTDAELVANAVLKRRDYPFCLYPEMLLRPFCQQFLIEQLAAQTAAV